MSAFRFSLQKVLELRERSELESARGLADARRDADDTRRARESLETARQAGLDRIAQAHGAGTAVGHLQNLTHVVNDVEDRIRQADAACEEAERQVDDKMDLYQKAVQQRRTIEELRERKLNQWRMDEVRNERKTMDEIAVNRHSRPETERE